MIWPWTKLCESGCAGCGCSGWNAPNDCIVCGRPLCNGCDRDHVHVEELSAAELTDLRAELRRQLDHVHDLRLNRADDEHRKIMEALS